LLGPPTDNYFAGMLGELRNKKGAHFKHSIETPRGVIF